MNERKQKFIRDVVDVVIMCDCASTVIDIKYTDSSNMVTNGIAIRKCPPKVIEALVTRGYMVRVEEGIGTVVE